MRRANCDFEAGRNVLAVPNGPDMRGGQCYGRTSGSPRPSDGGAPIWPIPGSRHAGRSSQAVRPKR